MLLIETNYIQVNIVKTQTFIALTDSKSKNRNIHPIPSLIKIKTCINPPHED